jgi:peptidoglycan hydrolase-like protein with peptidoglycan-binding domain
MPSGHGMFAGTPYETAPIQIQRRIITDAQRILARRGLFKDAVDGAYGPSMEFSLRAYQSRVGLPTTGRLDLETLAALQLLPGAHAPVFTPRRAIGPADAPVRGEWVRP